MKYKIEGKPRYGSTRAATRLKVYGSKEAGKIKAPRIGKPGTRASKIAELASKIFSKI
jgi:hypothetical protein